MGNIRKRIEILEPSIPSSCGRETQDRIGQPAQHAEMLDYRAEAPITPRRQ
jgi:hypothetical protein